eukprot:scaffold224346_cov15-Prasinocladus_malaysianus.AAC.1
MSAALGHPRNIGRLTAHLSRYRSSKVKRMTCTHTTSVEEIRRFALMSFGVGHCHKLQRFQELL